jgi:hypothetical protein
MQVILPSDVMSKKDIPQREESKILTSSKKPFHDFSKLTHLFIVMEHVEMDLKKILDQHTKSMD